MFTAILVLAAAESTAVAPTGPWQLNYAVQQCVAEREFATPKGPVTLLLKPSPTSDVLQLNLVTNEPRQIASESEARLTIEGAQPVPFRQLRFSSGKLTFRQINLPGDFAARLERSTHISWASRGIDLQFNTGNLAKLMKGLKACRESLRDYWNIETRRQVEIQSPPIPIKPLIKLFDTRDYPTQSARAGHSGASAIVVLIDETGLVRDCMLDATSGFAIIDAMTCAVITERARFKPAIDGGGKPVRAPFFQRVRWLVPD